MFFCLIGANSKGMADRTKIYLYKAFIRSKMEYALCIMPHRQGLIKKLEVAQHRMICSLFSVHHNCKRSSIRAYTMLQTMQQRFEELHCGWECRLPRKTAPAFLIDSANRAAMANHPRTSCFYNGQCANNPLLERCRANGIIGRHDWEDGYDEIRLQYHVNARIADKDDSSRPGCMTICDDGRPRQAWKIGKTGIGTRRLLFLYMHGRLIGEPKTCQKCRLVRCSQAHMLECTGFGNLIDVEIVERRYGRAIQFICTAIRSCLPECSMYDRLLDNG
jgi:hypothetical protein